MVDFSYLSSDTDESAVEELISQAQDLCVLEQVSAINCSSFSDSSLLPSDLESRFRKLKSFPLAIPRPKHSTPPPPHTRNDFKTNQNYSAKADGRSSSGKDDDDAAFSHSKRGRDEKLGSRPRSPSGYDSLSLGSSDFSKENGAFSPSKENPGERRGSSTNLKRGSISSPSNSSDSSLENLISSTSKQGPDEKRCEELKPKLGLFISPGASSISLSDSPSPPKKIGCFWCSPKKASHNKSKENQSKGINLDWGKNDECLSDLSSFSTKQQQKMLKKAMKEEEKISREAEKIVEWAKQASARLSVSGIEDELSDD